LDHHLTKKGVDHATSQNTGAEWTHPREEVLMYRQGAEQLQRFDGRSGRHPLLQLRFDPRSYGGSSGGIRAVFMSTDASKNGA
jgi:hypothetical protein